MAYFARVWGEGVPIAEIVAVVSAMLGEPVKADRLSELAAREGLRRPPGFYPNGRSVSFEALAERSYVRDIRTRRVVDRVVPTDQRATFPAAGFSMIGGRL